MSGKFQKEIEIASVIARAAGKILLGLYHSEFSISVKEGSGPVTEADQLANDFIVEELRKYFPNDSIVSEESKNFLKAFEGRRVWYVDPMDGTQEFILKNGEFSVMLGLALEGVSCAGVVYKPVGDVLFAGAAEGGAWMEKDGLRAPIFVSNKKEMPSLRMAASRSHRSSLIDAVKTQTGIRQEVQIGSIGLKIGLIASGNADIYIEPCGVLKAWDTCAPEAVLKAAGGRFTVINGESLMYDNCEGYLGKGVLAVNSACHERVVQALAPFVCGTKLVFPAIDAVKL